MLTVWRCNRYEDDLQLARNLGSNAFRFSLEWSRVEPVRGQICKPALRRYHKMIDCMIRRAQAEQLARLTLHGSAALSLPVWGCSLRLAWVAAFGTCTCVAGRVHLSQAKHSGM